MQYSFGRTNLNTLQLLINYLKLKLDLVATANEQQDWTYNHRIYRMLIGIGLLLPHGPEIDVSDIFVKLFQVGVLNGDFLGPH